MIATPRILILYAHPAPHFSRVNRRLSEAAKAVPNVKVQDLYETYPDFDIDVKREQALLVESDLIVFQHPIQWYGMPSLLKEWVDVVLEYGWAYGPGGTALKGKNFWLVASTDSPGAAYQEDAHHGHAFSVFLPPFRQTAVLCGMRWLPPLILHGTRRVDDPAIDAHADAFRRLLQTYPNWPERVAEEVHFLDRESRQE